MTPPSETTFSNHADAGHAVPPFADAFADAFANAFAEATVLLQAGESAAARASLHALVARFPQRLEAQVNLALAHERCGDAPAAEAAYLAALAIDPMQVQACINFAVFLMRRARFAEAQTLLRRALLTDPWSVAAWSNLGVLLAGIDEGAAAEECLRRAIAIDPTFQKAHFNLAYLLLRRGAFDEGWRCLEHRETEPQPEAVDALPLWRGEPLAGRAILITPEGGHGDLLQFCRYARLLKAHGAARVAILCHPSLRRLLAGVDGIDVAASLQDALAVAQAVAGSDLQVRLLSLPGLCGTDGERIPAWIPYLRPPGSLDGVARQRLQQHPLRAPAHSVLKVGLVWHGNPLFENDAARSLRSAAVLAPLADVEGAQFFSLQRHAAQAADAAAAGHAINAGPLCMTDLGDLLSDFGATADIVCALNLVIAVDTAVAHLAAGLGVECWLLLPAFRPDWRWLDAGETSAWYPGVLRLFRQETAGEWGDVVMALRSALATRCSSLA